MLPGGTVQDLYPDRIKYTTAAMNPRPQTDSPTDAGIKSNPTRAAPANTPKIAIRMLRQMRFIIFRDNLSNLFLPAGGYLLAAPIGGQ